MKRKSKAPAPLQPEEVEEEEVMEEEEMEEDEEEEEEGEGEEHDEDDDEDDDDEEDEEDEEEDEGSAGPVVKKAKTGGRGDARYAVPTAEEARHLRETEDLFRSNLLRLEVAEVLSEVRVAWGSKRVRAVEAFLHRLRAALLGLKKQTRVESSLHLPGFPPRTHSQQQEASDEGWSFSPPESVDVVGSFLLKTMCKPSLVVDVAVGLPAGLLTRFDHLNYQYFNKRNAYLAHLDRELSSAAGQRALGGGVGVRVERFKGDGRRPVLVLEGGEALQHQGGFSVRLLPLLRMGGGYGLERRMLALTRCNVRREVHFKAGEEQPATPHYSTAILEEAAHKQHLALLHHHLGQAPGLCDGVMLLKVWAAQREMGVWSLDSLDGCLAAMLAVRLLETKRINPRMEALPCFMALLSFLAETDLTAQPLFIDTPLQQQGAEDDEQAAAGDSGSSVDYSRLFEVTLMVRATGVNVAARMSRSAAEEVRREARASLALLQDSSRHALTAVLMTPVPLLRAYDYVVRLPTTAPELQLRAPPPADEEALLCDVTEEQALARRVEAIWRQALGDRALRIRTVVRRGAEGLVVEVWGAVGVDPTHALRLVDRGPPADQTEEAKKFRALWGRRSELRRFRDGGIVEAVVWTADPAQRHTIVPTIMDYALHLHLPHRWGAPGSSSVVPLLVRGNDLDALLDLSPATSDADGVTRAALLAYDRLAGKLKALRGMPLTVQGLEAVSPALRYTSVFPPLPHPLAHGTGKLERQMEGQQVSANIEPLLVQVRLEGSSKWPEDVSALRQAKTAFLIHMARQLQRDPEVKATASREWLDVGLAGLVFRVSLALPKELRLLEAQAHAQPRQGWEEEVEAVSVRLVSGPVHHRLVQACHTQRPLYGAVVRLTGIWAAHHLLDSHHLPQELLELLVAWVFARPHPFQPPGSALAGVVSVLSVLSSHDWRASPLVVDPHAQLSREEVESAEKAFEALRGPELRLGPAMVVVAPYDKERGWRPSWGCPERVVLSRVVSLAKASLDRLVAFLGSSSSDNSPNGWRRALTPRLLLSPDAVAGTFDAIIRLKESVVGPLQHEYRQGGEALAQYRQGCPGLRSAKLYRNTAAASTAQRVVGFDPVGSLLCRLREEHGELALFFTNPLHATAIAVVWRPAAFLPSPFAVLQSRRHAPVSGKSGAPVLVPNVMEVVAEWRALGQGLVDDIHVL